MVTIILQELLDVIKSETEDTRHEDFGMFVLVIMSHGTENDCFYGTDLKTVRLVDICELLAGRNFPAMEGKPKLIIVQACAGGKNYQSIFLYSDFTIVSVPDIWG